MAMHDLEIIRREIPSNEVADNQCLADDSVINIETQSLGTVNLVVKKTPYVENPADLMLTAPDSKVSQLTDFNKESGTEYLSLCGNVVSKMHQQIGKGMPVIALNQQSGCALITSKFASDGTELKIQTIDEIHAHLFIETGEGRSIGSAHTMEVADQMDFMDPFGLAVGKLLYRALENKEIEVAPLFEFRYETSRFPLGLTIELKENIATATKRPEFFEMLNHLQSKYAELYHYVKGELTNDDGSLKDRKKRKEFISKLLENHDLTPSERRALETIGVATKGITLEERKNMRLVQGPALTWIIYEDREVTRTNMNFRIVSRGNASDALGVWVEPYGEADVERRSQLHKFYIALADQLKDESVTVLGPALKRYEE